MPRTLTTNPTQPVPFGDWGWPAWPAFALLALGGLAFLVDCRLSAWLNEDPLPTILSEVLENCESFGHFVGVILVALGCFSLDPARRAFLPRVVGLAAMAGGLASCGKLLVARMRPGFFPVDENETAWNTFGAWFPGTELGSKWQSFPSGHTATATALALGLCWLYPRGRYFFGALPVLVALQRMQGGAHFLSDTVFSAALACGLVYLHKYDPVLGRLATRWENWRSLHPAKCNTPAHIEPALAVSSVSLSVDPLQSVAPAHRIGERAISRAGSHA